MEKKKFLDKGGAEVIANKINLIATVVDKLMDADQIKVITEVELNNTPINELEPNVQYNIVGKSVDFGEIWVHNNITGENGFFSRTAFRSLSPDIYTPIGLVVIPASHNVYGDGTPGVMALKSAKASTPDTGGDEESISWGEYGTLDLPELPNLTTAPSLKWEPNIMSEPTTQQSETGYLCVDFGTTVANPYDSKRGWRVKIGTHIGSPFNEDGSKNAAYFTGATNDFDGAGNTDKFEDMYLGRGDLGLINALAAYRVGDNYQDWYIPATGELGYVAVNRNLLNATLAAAGQREIELQKHWTSSKFNTSNLRCIDMSNGQVAYAGGNSVALVRPFRKASGTATVGQFWTGAEFKNTYDSTCIGIVVIPTSHDVYGDGSCGVMALHYATLTGPGAAVGIKASEQHVAFVPDSIKSPYRCIGVDGAANINHSELSAPEGTTCIPSDAFSGQLSADGSTKYYYNPGPFAPSPYTSNGSKNELFFGQCLADFNGKTNTEAILSHVTVENWQTAHSINNPTISGGVQSMPIGEFPAACCCWRYHTVGTNQGDWYLPAAGELAYVCARQNEINAIIAEIFTRKAGSATRVAEPSAERVTRNWYWSSSEFNTLNARAVNFSDGGMSVKPRYSQIRVRPFIRVTV